MTPRERRIARKIAEDFKSGTSLGGCSLKYGVPFWMAEKMLRWVMVRQRDE